MKQISTCKKFRNKHVGDKDLHSEDGARQLVKSGVADLEIEQLHQEMKKKDYWVWTRGALEDHLGVEGKDESVWAEFNQRLKEEGVDDAISEPKKVREFVHWLASVGN
jgi:hypothetical protein